MKYSITLPLPQQWKSEIESYIDESGEEITHLGAVDGDLGNIDIYAGPMPEDETAEDQALANYVEVVGFDESNPDDFNPIQKIKFNGKNAWIFSALCEEGGVMRFISQEVRSGVLAIIAFTAADDPALEQLQGTIERGLRIKNQ